MTAHEPPTPSTTPSTVSLAGGGVAPDEASRAARLKEVAGLIRRWDRRSILELHGLLTELRNLAESFGQNPEWYVEPETIPSAPLPATALSTGILASDVHGICLVRPAEGGPYAVRALRELFPDALTGPHPLAERPVPLPPVRSKRITVTFSHEEYLGILRGMAEESEPRIAAWIRRALQRDLARERR